MSVAVRFAPSPTGQLHIGNIRTAVLNYLFALKSKGRFLLRLDDTDRERSTEAFAQGIRDDLDWLGLATDWTASQSDRLARYAEVAEELKAAGILYPCYEAADELERRRRRQLARGLPPIYDRSALKLTEEERARIAAEGRRPHWRFRLPNTEGREALTPLPTLVSWNDLIRGDQTVDLGSLSDPVLIREDDTFLYTFTSVIDDVDFGITHIVRGGDHITNTGVQVALFEALGAVPPAFAHHSLLIDADGSALSKRSGALSIASLRDDGFEPMAIVSHAALVGTSDAIEPHADLDSLAEKFRLLQDLIGAGALRRQRASLAQCTSAPSARLRCGRLAPQWAWCRRWRNLLACGARQSRKAVGRVRLVAGGLRRHRAVDRGRGIHLARGKPASGRALGRDDLVDMDHGRKATDRGEGPGAVSPLAAGINRTRSRPRAEGAAAPHRPPAYACKAMRGNDLTAGEDPRLEQVLPQSGF